MKTLSVVPDRVTAKCTHWFRMLPADTLRRYAPASHTYSVPPSPPSMLTPIDAFGHDPTWNTRVFGPALLWKYWNHSTVKSPVPTAQSALPGTDRYLFVPLSETLPPFTADTWLTVPSTRTTANSAASIPLRFLTSADYPAQPPCRRDVSDAEPLGNEAQLGVWLHHRDTHVA